MSAAPPRTARQVIEHAITTGTWGGRQISPRDFATLSGALSRLPADDEGDGDVTECPSCGHAFYVRDTLPGVEVWLIHPAPDCLNAEQKAELREMQARHDAETEAWLARVLPDTNHHVPLIPEREPETAAPLPSGPGKTILPPIPGEPDDLPAAAPAP
jgi:hypothetical protein